MSSGSGGKGGASRVSIPSGVKKMIENIKEITGQNHSEDEIYAILEECSMDPNETAQKLLLLDTFFEVKGKHDRKKENLNKEPAELKWKPGNRARTNRVGRGNYAPRYMSHDADGGRNAAAEKEKATSKAPLATADVKKNETTPVASQIAGVCNGPSGFTSQSTNVIHHAGEGVKQSSATGNASMNKLEGPLSLSSPIDSFGKPIAPWTKDIQHLLLLDLSNSGTSMPSALGSRSYFSSSDHVTLPSQDVQLPGAVGSTRRELESQRTPVELADDFTGSKPASARISSPEDWIKLQEKIPDDFQEVGKNPNLESLHVASSTIGVSTVSRPSSNYNNRPQVIGPQKDTFHEVKTKRDRKKENLNKEPAELKWKPGNRARTNRVGRGNYAPRYMSHDADGGRNAAAEKEKATSKAPLATADVKKNETTPVASQIAGVCNGPSGFTSQSTNVINHAGEGVKQSSATGNASMNKLEGPLSLSSPIDSFGKPIAPWTKDIQHLLLLDLSNSGTSIPSALGSRSYFSSSDHVTLPSQDIQLPGAVGSTRRELESQRSLVELADDFTGSKPASARIYTFHEVKSKRDRKNEKKEKMSNGVKGGAIRDSIPSGIKKTIQNIKEIVGQNHSEDEIYAMAKKCSVDPIETAQKLLYPDTFHEVKKNRDRKKENLNKEPAELKWKPGNQARTYRVGRGNYAPLYMSRDADGGRNAAAEKEKTTSKAPLATAGVKKNETTPVASQIAGVCNGPSGLTSQSTNVIHHAGEGVKQSSATDNASISKLEGPLSLSSPIGSFEKPIAPWTKDIQQHKMLDLSNSGTSIPSAPASRSYFSSSDHVTLPSQDVPMPGAVGSTRRALESQRTPVELADDFTGSKPASARISTPENGIKLQEQIPDDFQEVEKNQNLESLHAASSTIGVSTVSRPSYNYNNRPQVIGPQKVCPGKQCKPKSANPSTGQGANTAASSEISVVSVGSHPESQTTPLELQRKLEDSHISEHVIIPNHLHVPDVEKLGICFGSFELLRKLEDSQISEHVIIPNHLLVPDVEKLGICFGSFDASFGLETNQNGVPGGDESPPLSESSEAIDEPVKELESSYLFNLPKLLIQFFFCRK